MIILSVGYLSVDCRGPSDFGAVEQQHVKPEIASGILEELEDWGRYISCDPELGRVLQSFADVAEA